jgi:outer membrane protein assembly factor BamB
VVFDRVADRMRTRCFEAETGTPLWEVSYASDYRDTFGYDGGPRAAPVIHGDRVLTFGPEGRLECRSLADGASLWSIDTAADYHVVQNFFGVGAAPLVVRVGGDDLVVVQVGGSPPGSAPAAPERLDLVKGLDSGLVAFDLATGRERWRCSSQLASYAAPVLAAIDGQPRIIAWMRADLLVVDPASGAVLAEFRWRADDLFSAIAASPVVAGDEVLLSECSGPGSVMLDLTGGDRRVVRRDRTPRPRSALMAHWATPIVHDGHLYGSSGRNAGDALAVCVEWTSGRVRWSEPGLGRASMVLVDGHLVILGEFGDLVLARATPEQFHEVSRARLVADDSTPLLSPPCWAAPVVARGLLFARGAGRLVCIDLIAN